MKGGLYESLRSTVVVVNQVPNLLRRSRLFQGGDEILVLQAARHAFEGTQVFAGPFLWRDEHDQDVYRLVVDAVIGDARLGQGDGADQPIDAGVFGMRDGDALADAGRTEHFALE